MSITQITEQEQRLTHTLRTTTEALLAVTAERDALRADAERYRWLFEKTITTQPELVRVLVMHQGQYVQRHGMHLDAAIDVAMKGKS